MAFWSRLICLNSYIGSRWFVIFMNLGSLIASLPSLSMKEPHYMQHFFLIKLGQGCQNWGISEYSALLSSMMCIRIYILNSSWCSVNLTSSGGSIVTSSIRLFWVIGFWVFRIPLDAILEWVVRIGGFCYYFSIYWVQIQICILNKLIIYIISN